jgi:hypothetical protein
MVILLTVSMLAASPMWYRGQLLCPFYCTKTWICGFTPCKDEAKARKICERKSCWEYRP